METIYRDEHGLVSLKCDGEHVLHDTRKKEVSEIRQTTIKVVDLDYWEELPASAITTQTEGEYKERVVSLIRERYDGDEESAIQRKAISLLLPSPLREGETQEGTEGDTTDGLSILEEFAAYNAYVEECKRKAREILNP